jgi:hypothetical protein
MNAPASNSSTTPAAVTSDISLGDPSAGNFGKSVIVAIVGS